MTAFLLAADGSEPAGGAAITEVIGATTGAMVVTAILLALEIALLGMYWDISLHIDDGRDAGPLANPAH